jgi:hypothetical protein
MPSRNNRNATRQSPKSNLYQQSLLAEIGRVPSLGFTNDEEPPNHQLLALPESMTSTEPQGIVGVLKEAQVVKPDPFGRHRGTPELVDTSDGHDTANAPPTPHILTSSPRPSHPGDDIKTGHTRAPVLVR